MSAIQDLSSYVLPSRRKFINSFRFILWYLTGRLIVSSGLPGTWWRKAVLRIFGSQIGEGGRIKPRVFVSCPWLLLIGDHCWIGEGVWIDNLASVTIGNHVCISQGAYLCTGNHDYRKSSFDLKLSPIMIDSEAWLAAYTVLAPGSHIGSAAVVSLGSVVSGNVSPGVIVQGNPARVVGIR